MSVTFNVGRSRLVHNLERFDERAKDAIQEILQYQALNTESWVRSNARWSDQTGNARNGLFTRVFRNGDQFTILISHTMPYGIWLEVRFAGRYEIIVPGINYTMQELRSLLQQLFRRMEGG